MAAAKLPRVFLTGAAGEFRFDGPDVSKNINEPSLDAFVPL
jgi:hypothetical protein